MSSSDRPDRDESVAKAVKDLEEKAKERGIKFTAYEQNLIRAGAVAMFNTIMTEVREWREKNTQSFSE